MTTSEVLKIALIGVFSALVIIAALRDIVTYTIPNWITGALALAFLPAAFFSGAQPLQILCAFGVGAAILVLGILMFALKWVGGGDAKLMAAAGLWLGLPGLAPFAAYTALAGGALAFMLLALRSDWLRPIAQAGPIWLNRLATPGGAAPYGLAVAVGALAALPQSILVHTAPMLI